jgi:hypothetical protein
LSVQLDFVLSILIALDAALYFFLIMGYLRNRNAIKVPKSPTPQEAFAYFEKSYMMAFPEDRGFTWAEATAKASGLARLHDFEWERVQRSVRQYEAYRYGGITAQQVDTYPILKLATELHQKA